MQLINFKSLAMEFKELNKEEHMFIFGGNEASDGFWYTVGLVLRALHEIGTAAQKDGGYAKNKCP